ncbi:MarR family winged helix-turn-helix transcriptional regulator [Bacillus carboniphilus]|uniref:MarR family winged helix-turn-helix transcriptional regulator n=1 Tax=Bacillus carboniphilus TaxID=86663 RepID=A0ABN0W7P5_9BACI
MNKEQIQELIDRYVSVSFKVNNKAEWLIKEQIGSDLTYEQHYTLRFIHQNGKCTSTQLAEAFDVNKSAITAIITRLTDKEIIKRTRDPEDRRVVYLTLTDKGEKLYSESEKRVHALVGNIITQFNSEEIETFIQTYEKLLKILLNIQDQSQEEESK